MRLPKKKAKVVLDVLHSLEVHKAITPEVAEAVRSNIEPIAFDWRRLARYSFVAALCCVVIAVVATFCDQAVIAFLEKVWTFVRRFFHAPIIVRSVVMAAASVYLLVLGLRLKAKEPGKIYTNEAVFTISAMGFGVAVMWFCKSINVVDAQIVLGASSVLYFGLGFFLESKLIWAYGILVLSSALGSGTDYGGGCYCLGLDYPLRSLILGAILFLGAECAAASSNSRVKLLYGVTRVFGLLHIFISLWILSIWGTDWDYRRIQEIRWELAFWSVLFGLVSVAAVVRALFKDDSVLRGFGLTFFFIGLYTKYFEYFWDGLHKAIFFAILGVSFWLIGRKAEAIWRMKLPAHEV